jgi:HPt (histidine-containing phosphotransfer) domain-containing protein
MNELPQAMRSAEADDLATDSSIVNLERALARLNGDLKLYGEMVQFLLEDGPPLVVQIRSAAHASDHHAAGRAAHSLRNLAATCGGESAARAAHQVEQLAAQGESEQLRTAAEALNVEFETLVGYLRRFTGA